MGTGCTGQFQLASKTRHLGWFLCILVRSVRITGQSSKKLRHYPQEWNCVHKLTHGTSQLERSMPFWLFLTSKAHTLVLAVCENFHTQQSCPKSPDPFEQVNWMGMNGDIGIDRTSTSSACLCCIHCLLKTGPACLHRHNGSSMLKLERNRTEKVSEVNKRSCSVYMTYHQKNL